VSDKQATGFGETHSGVEFSLVRRRTIRPSKDEDDYLLWRRRVLACGYDSASGWRLRSSEAVCWLLKSV
jgi:hypothetical protein